MSTIHNTYQLPNNLVYLGSAITFPQNQKNWLSSSRLCQYFCFSPLFSENAADIVIPQFSPVEKASSNCSLPPKTCISQNSLTRSVSHINHRSNPCKAF